MLLLGWLAACDDGAPVRPARLEVDAGDAQTGVVGTVLAVEPAVRVLADDGQPVANVTVTFEAAGGGSIVNTSASTNGNGIARAGAWRLGTRAGTQELRVTVTGLPVLSLQASARAAAPSAITVLSGAGQRGVAGSVLPVAPNVRVRDVFDNAVPDAPVTFTVSAGGGSVPSPNVITQADGTASPGAWRLGGQAGQQTLTVSAGADAVFVISAMADAGEASRLVLQRAPAATASSGEALPVQPVLQIGDSFGNAVPHAGLAVSASLTGATLTSATAITDAAGAATFTGLTISGAVGPYVLRFTAPDLSAVETDAIALGPGAAAQLAIITAPPVAVTSGSVFGTPTVVEVRDAAGNRVTAAGHAVTASLATGSGQLQGDLSVNAVQGRATFDNLTYTGEGPIQLRFQISGLPALVSSMINVGDDPCSGASLLTLDYALGESARFRADDGIAPQCLQFDLTRNQGQQYLVLVENMARRGNYTDALFPGPGSAPTLLGLRVIAATAPVAAVAAARPVLDARSTLPAGMSHAWDFGSGPIYEYSPPEPPGGVPAPALLRGGRRVELQTAVAPALGDTIVVYLVGIPRLSIPDGNQRAVIRHISDELIIAEDVRLSTLLRSNGAPNTPLTQADMDSIARAYAAHARTQADLLFDGRHNQATEQETPARVIAVHTVMPQNNVWGYTFSSTNVFAWDFWVSTNGSTRGFAQHPLRNAHNLFMHEIAHMRHWGLLERTNRENERGNRWLVEGFARFTERLPVASYLLNQPDPSRTGNVILGAYPEYTVRFRDDVPTYLHAGASMFGGYEASSFVFDYFADQVALAGGNWRQAVAQFLTYAGVESELDVAIGSQLPGLTFQQLFTRARLALYLDDIGTAGLPSWTQYHQYNLRGSREPASAASSDPRNAWPRIQPGAAFTELRLIGPGGAFGYVIDGQAATGNARITFEFESPDNAVISVTRIR